MASRTEIHFYSSGGWKSKTEVPGSSVPGESALEAAPPSEAPQKHFPEESECCVQELPSIIWNYMFYLEVIVDLQAVVKNNPEDPMDPPPSVPQVYLISLGDNTTTRTLSLT